MFCVKMARLCGVRAWARVAVPLVILAVAFFSVAPDFTFIPAVSRTAHRVHLPVVGLAVFTAPIPTWSAPILSSPAAALLHGTVHDRVIDLTCSRLC